MASEDVIELGSSDEDLEPPPKKVKPNVMVHIPGSSLTITPMKVASNSKRIDNSSRNSKQKFPKTIACNTGKDVTSITKNIVELIHSGKHVKLPPHIPINKRTPHIPIQKRTPHIPIQKHTQAQGKQLINPMLLKKLNNSQVVIHKVPSSSVQKCPSFNKSKINKSMNNPTRPPQLTLKKPELIQYPKLVSNKHTNKRYEISHDSNEVLSVELDDDEPMSSKASPQWYLRPEDGEKNEEDNNQNINSGPVKNLITNNLMEINNKEPDASKFIEITIEDSPVKPQDKRTFEVTCSDAITIDDSPIKIVEKNNTNLSDEEIETDKDVPQSKKKLEYPKETEAVEIEIEPFPADHSESRVVNYEKGCNNKEESSVNCDVVDITDVIETLDKPQKEVESVTKINKEEILNKIDNEKTGEFHPIYKEFIELCFRLENSEDMKTIVEKKIKNYYRQVPKSFTESEEFVDMVSSKIESMKAAPDKMYLFIKDIVDELNLQRKVAKTQVEDKPVDKENDIIHSKDNEYDFKRQRQIRKLEKTLKKLHRAIQKLEEQEVDFDDEEDSVYLLTERYKERMVRVHAKFCQLTNTKMPSEPYIHLEARPGQPAGPIKRLEKWINKKVPIGTPLPFPDFHDVLRCVKEANEEDRLGWNDADLMEQARDLFTRCGKKLQRRRQENEWRLAISRVTTNIDPAEQDETLTKKLNDNRQIAAKKETEVFDKFADRQNQLKLEGEEIGDKEAEESPADSEEDGTIDERVSSENKEKRKERLKRFLQKSKSKKSEEKENLPSVEVNKSSNEKSYCQDEERKKLEEKECNNLCTIPKDTTDTLVVNNEIENVDTVAEIEGNDKISESEEIQNISDDKNSIDSDIDELHLLQKLHSGSENYTSAEESSDSESPIAISDTLESSSDEERNVKQTDVISIENSSFSESETNDRGENEELIMSTEVSSEGMVNSANIENCNKGDEKQENVMEIDESLENTLLASSDDENFNSKNGRKDEIECINLKDDSISIGETVIEKICNESSTETLEHNEIDKIDKTVNIEDDSISNSAIVIDEHCIDVLKENQSVHELSGKLVTEINVDAQENSHLNEPLTEKSTKEKEKYVCNTSEKPVLEDADSIDSVCYMETIIVQENSNETLNDTLPACSKSKNNIIENYLLNEESMSGKCTKEETKNVDSTAEKPPLEDASSLHSVCYVENTDDQQQSHKLLNDTKCSNDLDQSQVPKDTTENFTADALHDDCNIDSVGSDFMPKSIESIKSSINSDIDSCSDSTKEDHKIENVSIQLPMENSILPNDHDVNAKGLDDSCCKSVESVVSTNTNENKIKETSIVS